jgi:hypothetical protein
MERVLVALPSGQAVMEVRSVARGRAGAPFAILNGALASILTGALASISIGVLAPSGASAQDPKAAGAGSGPACVLRGNRPGPKGALIFDAAAGGRAVASFTGALVPLVLSDFPADPSLGRARIATTTGSASFRIEGWAAPGAFDVLTTRDVPVAAGHVWIASAQKVRLVQAGAGALTAELVVPGGQAARAAAPCDAFSLQPGTPTAMEVPGNGRGYLSKAASLDLFDDAGGAVVFTLKAAPLFWSTESRDGFVHVRTRGALAVDAWARARDLDPLKPGETMDQYVPPTTAVTGAQIALGGAPRVVKVARDTPVRAKRGDAERSIGVVEAGAEVYVMEMMVGWINVLPKGLGLMPEGEGGFWIPDADAPR